MLHTIIQNFQMNPVICWASLVMAIYSAYFGIKSILNTYKSLGYICWFYVVAIITVLVIAPAGNINLNTAGWIAIVAVLYAAGLLVMPYMHESKI